MTPLEPREYTVLVVDDDPDLLHLVKDGLELLGHFNVIIAEDGASGLEQFFTMRPDCVIIDVVMPGLNGYQLVQALRGDPESANIPLILMTALAQDKNKLSGMIVGADYYLVKPVTPNEIIQTVHNVLAISEAQRTARLNSFIETSDIE